MKCILIILIMISLYSCNKDDEPITTARVMNATEQVYSRYNEWVGNDIVIVFPIITDLHSGGNDNYKHISYVNETDKIFNYNFIANLGDIGLDVEATNTVESANLLLSEISARHREYSGITLFCKGNHDQNGGSNTIISNERLASFLQITPPNSPNYDYNRPINKNYGYLEFKTQKVRVFFTDSSDIDYYGYSEEQLKYIIDNLTSMPSNYTAVILTHLCPNEIGRWYYKWNPNPSPFRITNRSTFREIFKGFVAKTTGEAKEDKISLSWNFTKSSGKLAGILCGDSHFDANTTIDGVNLVITQGYGYISDHERPPHAIVTHFDRNSEILVDIVAIKPSKREMRYFRLGAGGDIRDRSFYF